MSAPYVSLFITIALAAGFSLARITTPGRSFWARTCDGAAFAIALAVLVAVVNASMRGEL